MERKARPSPGSGLVRQRQKNRRCAPVVANLVGWPSAGVEANKSETSVVCDRPNWGRKIYHGKFFIMRQHENLLTFEDSSVGCRVGPGSGCLVSLTGRFPSKGYFDAGRKLPISVSLRRRCSSVSCTSFSLLRTQTC